MNALVVFVFAFISNSLSVHGFSAGPPNCTVSAPGHEGTTSQTPTNPKGLPVEFSVVKVSNGDYMIDITGGHIKGFLIREKGVGGIWKSLSDFSWSSVGQCAKHTADFSGRPDTSSTNLVFSYTPGSNSPVFEAIVVKDYEHWWDKITIKDDGTGYYETKLN